MSDTPTPQEAAESGLSRHALLAIFDVLTLCAGTPESLREEFIHALQRGTREFRIGGSLGFGGKYWPETNTVSCYREAMTDRRRAIITDTNGHLAHLAARLANDVVWDGDPKAPPRQ
jgi:hypothetical protein